MRKENPDDDSRTRLRSYEIGLLVVAVPAFLLFLYLYMNDLTFTEWASKSGLIGGWGMPEGQSIASIESISGELRGKRARELQFKPLNQGDSVFEGDTLSTLESSVATIKFHDGSSLEMSPNSMMVIHFEKDFSLGAISRVPSIDVKQGSVVGQTKTSNLVIKVGNQKINIAKESKRQVHAAPQPTSESSAEGLQKGTTPSPSPGSAISPTQPGRKKTAQATLMTPAHLQEFQPSLALLQEGIPLEFQWKMAEAPKDLALIIEEVSPSGEIKRSRSKIIPSQKSETYSLTFKVDKPGAYQWHIQPSPEQKDSWEIHYGKKSRFFVKQTLTGIKTLPPVFIQQGKSALEIRLNWERHPKIKKYEIIVARDAQGLDQITSQETTQDNLIVKVDSGKTREVYFWVIGKTDSGFKVLSERKNLKLSLGLPSLLSPENSLRLPLLTGGQLSVEFRWSKVPLSEAYLFELDQSPDFSQNPVRKQTRSESLKTDLAPGIYYWRVKALSRVLPGRFSDPSRVIVERR